MATLSSEALDAIKSRAGAVMILKGATRAVLLAGRYAYKFPRFANWPLFLCGLLANMQEAQFSKAGWPELCPVEWSVPGGLLVVMRRATPLTTAQWLALDVGQWSVTDNYVVPVEAKRDSFGTLDGQLVAVDYGSSAEFIEKTEAE